MLKKIIKENIGLLIVFIFLIVGFYIMFCFENIALSIESFDELVFKKIFFNSNLFIVIMKVFTFFGGAYIPVTIIIIMMFFKNIRKDTYFLSIVYILSGLIILISKYLIARERPDMAIIDIPITPSFPSGHSFTSMVFYFMFGYIFVKKMNIKYKKLVLFIFIFLSLNVGLSRIFLGVHYFSDVIGGFVLSIPIILITINVYNEFLEGEI